MIWYLSLITELVLEYRQQLLYKIPNLGDKGKNISKFSGEMLKEEIALYGFTAGLSEVINAKPVRFLMRYSWYLVLMQFFIIFSPWKCKDKNITFAIFMFFEPDCFLTFSNKGDCKILLVLQYCMIK